MAAIEYLYFGAFGPCLIGIAPLQDVGSGTLFRSTSKHIAPPSYLHFSSTGSMAGNVDPAPFSTFYDLASCNSHSRNAVTCGSSARASGETT